MPLSRFPNAFAPRTALGATLEQAMSGLFPGPNVALAAEERRARIEKSRMDAALHKAQMEKLQREATMAEEATAQRASMPGRIAESFAPGQGADIMKFRGAGGMPTTEAVDVPPATPNDDEGYSMPMASLPRPSRYDKGLEAQLGPLLVALEAAAGGKSNVEQVAKASDLIGKNRARQEVMGGADPTTIAQSYFATSGAAPFQDHQGRVLNVSRGTQNEGGQQATANVAHTTAQTSQANAAAGRSNRESRVVSVADPMSPSGFTYQTPASAVGQPAPAPAGSAMPLGKPPRDMRWVSDGAGGFTGEPEVIPNSPLDLKNKQAREKKALAAESAKMKAKLVSETVDTALSQSNFWTTGAMGAVGSKMPGTPQYDLDATLDTLKSLVSFGELQNMRQSSPTGGALGGIAVRELELLGASIANIKQGQRGPQLVKNLKTVKQSLGNWLKAVEQDATPENPIAPPTAAAPSGAGTVTRYDAAANRVGGP